MKKTTTLKALVLSMIMTFGLVMPMAAQTDGFFKNNEDYINRDAATGNIINQTFGQDPATGITGGITNQQFGAPLGSGLLIMVAAGAGYAVARRKRVRKGMTLLLAAAMLLGMTQCKKNIETITSAHDNGVRITLNVNNNTRHHVVTTGDPWSLGGDLGKVEYTQADTIYVFNGGEAVGALSYNETSHRFEGVIGIQIFEDKPYPSIELDPNDRLYFCFLANANMGYDEERGLFVSIKSQKENLPVLSCGKTALAYGDYVEEGVYDYSCEMENKCALVKFTFNNVGDGVGLAGDDEVSVSGMCTDAIFGLDANGITMTPDHNATGLITLYHPSDSPANERWGILLPQDAVTGKSMLIRNWKYTGNVDVQKININAVEEVTVDCSQGNPTKYNLFTVRSGKKALFAPGNLQYRAYGDTIGWRFAKHQWDYVGGYWKDGDVTYRKGNVYTMIDETVVQCENNAIADDYNGWIDLFGFGTGDAPTKTTQDNSEYANYNDWGDYCSDPTGNGYHWYAPEAGEWICLMHYGTNRDAERLGFKDDIRIEKCGPAKVNGVEGFVFLPDYFEWPASYPSARFDPAKENEGGWATYTRNIITKEEWADLEANGAAFLPAAGNRKDYNNSSHDYDYDRRDARMFRYWAHNPVWTGFTANMIVMKSTPGLDASEDRYYGGAVRLMREIEFE